MEYSRVTYKFINNDTNQELVLANDPINWNESDKTLKRSTKTYGVYTELSKDLEFVKEAAKFLEEAYSLKDIEADVTMEEWRDYPDRDGQYLHSSGLFDFSDYSRTENKVKVPFNTGGLNAKIKAQYSEKFELERTEAINGDDIGEFEDKIEIALTSRKILLISTFERFDERTESFTASAPVRAFTMDILSNSDEGNLQPVVEEFISGTNDGDLTGDDLDPTPTQYFYFSSDADKTLTLSLKFDAFISVLNGSAMNVYVLHRDENDNEIEFRHILDTSYDSNNYEYSLDYTGDFNLSQGDKLCLLYSASGDPAGSTRINYIVFTDFLFTVTEESVREPSNTKGVFMHEVGERLMQIVTGESFKFKSNFYGRQDIAYANNGEYSKTAVVLGFWIRQFNDKNIEISIKDYIESSNALHNTGYTIETDVNGNEVLVLEDMRYFFRDEVAIVINEQVSNVKRKTAKELYYSSALFGYKKPSDEQLYEESMGLDEYNTNTGYTLPIERVDTKYEKLSAFRADTYGKEFARRKSKEQFPQQDTRYDKDKWVLDLKDSEGTNYQERVWQDDFEEAPSNVFSPETATNLRLTPYRCSVRHEWFYGSGVQKFQDKYVRFSNSLGNSDLETKKANEAKRSESGDKLISEMHKPRFINQFIEFNHQVDYDLNAQIYGKTRVDGKDVPNYFFKVQFINEKGQKEYGYLFELKPNKEGFWKLLKAI